ncbi:hypothetical protein ACS0TY_007642 [Phlomoides rotata]
MAEPQAAPSAPPPPATSTRTRTNAPPPTACACNRRPPPPPAPVTARNRQVIALQDLDLLKILESELHRELSSMSFQNDKIGSLGEFVVDSPQSQDVVLTLAEMFIRGGSGYLSVARP